MRRLLASFLLLAVSASAVAQEIPGLRVTLQARSLVPASQNAELVLTLQTTADAEVPAQLLNGHKLRVTCNEEPARMVEQAGKGGASLLAAGTRLERTLSFPTSALVSAAAQGGVARVFVSWDGLAGVGCDFKVAPDTSKIDVATLDLTKTQVVLVTSAGDLTLSFRPDKAPKHVANFIDLCRKGFYDGTRFHRVIKGFMIQGGCPKTKDLDKVAEWGSGGPGYTLDAEFQRPAAPARHAVDGAHDGAEHRRLRLLHRAQGLAAARSAVHRLRQPRGRRRHAGSHRQRSGAGRSADPAGDAAHRDRARSEEVAAAG